MRRLALIAGVLAAVTAQAADGPYFRRFVRNEVRSAPATTYYLSFLTSDPAAECDGSAISGITHTRASVAYCEDTDGFLVSRAVNSPRVSNKGVLVETSRTNLIIRNQELDNAAWTATNVTVTANQFDEPLTAGAATVAELLATSVSGGFIASTTAFVPSQTTGTASVWVYGRDDGSGGLGLDDFSIVIRDTTAGVDRATCTFEPAETWERHSCNVTGLTGANNHVMRLYPGGTAGEGSAYVWAPQFEVALANNRTSTIATAGASANRAIDVYTFANATDISAAGCLSATVTFGQSAQFGGSVLSNGTEMMMGSGSSIQLRMADGTNTLNLAASDLTGRTVTLRTSWSGSSMTIENVTDGTSASGTFDGSFSSTATMRIGATSAGAGYCNCHVKNIKVGSSATGCL